MTFSGVVLAGGASRRMGRDKALVEVGGRPMVLAAVDALAAAGAAEVLVVGGDGAALTALGLVVVADEHPGDGPLGGLVTALGRVACELVALLSCDLLAPSPDAVRAVVRALDQEPEAMWAAPLADGRQQFLHGAYRTQARGHWATAFAAGERSLRRPAEALPGILVTGVDPAALADADEPGDLPHEDG